jgi:hypothetical protein
MKNISITEKAWDTRTRKAVRKTGCFGLHRSRVNGLYMITDGRTGGAVAGWPLGGDSREYSLTAPEVVDWCKRYITDEQDMQTAVHEAGHAVIARVLALAAGGATIVPEPGHIGRSDYHISAGHSAIADPWACLHQWEIRGKFRANDAEIRARVITMMAGLEAELEIRGDHDAGADGSDLYQIALMLEGLGLSEQDQGKLEQRLRRMANMLVRRHRGLIVHTAEELFDRRTLTAEELDDVVGRSVHDIPINEAHLPPAEFRDPIERWESEEQ